MFFQYILDRYKQRDVRVGIQCAPGDKVWLESKTFITRCALKFLSKADRHAIACHSINEAIAGLKRGASKDKK